MEPIRIWDVWLRGYKTIEIPKLSNEELVDTFASEWESDSRRISSDGPTRYNDLKIELMRRLNE